MSEKNKNANLNNVSNSNIKKETDVFNIDVLKIIKEIDENTYKNDDEYKMFCDKYKNVDFSQYKIKKLKDIYEIGNGLLNQYFITEDNKCNKDIIIQLQYIISSIMYNIDIKQTHDYSKKNNALNQKLEKTIERAEKLEKDAKERAMEMKHVKNDMKSITATIISIVLAISIIPTAIAGIENINSNYIIPFISSIILFGMIMIIFVYSIYQDKIKMSTKVLLVITIIICVLLWALSFNFDICKTTNTDKQEYQEINNKIYENEVIENKIEEQ